MLYCSKCGEHGTEATEFDCGCEKLLDRQLLTIEEFQISTRVKNKVTASLTETVVFTSENKDYPALSNMVTSLNALSPPGVCNFATVEVAEALLAEIKTAAINPDKDMNAEPWRNFVTRPYSLSAAAMTNEPKFRDSFAFEAKLFDQTNTESKYVDVLLNRHFKAANPEVDLQQFGGLLVSEGAVVPIAALPDAVWQFEGQDYVVEVKTVKWFNNIAKYNVLPEWMRQVACYQLPSIQAAVAQLEQGAALPVDGRRYLLAVIALDLNAMFVLEANPHNLEASIAEWRSWFARRLDAQDLSDLRRYHPSYEGERVRFRNISRIKKDEKKRRAEIKAAAEGWSVQK
jgi:hypothetical protein